MLKAYIGTKLIHATPMNRLDYNNLRGWELPADEDGRDEGYLVIYPESTNFNVPGYTGYVSWSPEKEFDAAYHETDGLTFGLAIDAMKKGLKVARAGWNGKGMFVVRMPELYLPPHSSQEPGARVNDRTAKHIGEDTPLDSQPYYAMKTATGQWQPGWLASQADMDADDWMVV